MNLQNRKALLLLFIASMISNVAQGFTLISIPWYFATAEKTSTFNLVYMAITLASLFWGLFAGTLVDRYDRKRLFMLLNGVQGFLLLSAACYGYYFDYMPYWTTAAVFLVTIFGFSVHYPNVYALLQSITTPDNYTKVTSAMEIIGQSMTVLSGALITVLLDGMSETIDLFGLHFAIEIPKWTMADIFLLDGSTYFVALVLISLMRYQEVLVRNTERGSVVKRLRTGFAFLSGHNFILIFGLCSYAVFAMTIVELHGLMPAYVKQYLEEGVRVVGLGEIFYALGALLSGFFLARLFKGQSKLNLVLGLMFMSSVSFLAIGLTKEVALFYLFSMGIGLSNAGVRIMRVAWLFNHVPNEVIGRVNSVFSMANTTARVLFLGIFSFPLFTEKGGIPYAYGVSAAFVGLCLVILLLNKRHLDRVSKE